MKIWWLREYCCAKCEHSCQQPSSTLSAANGPNVCLSVLTKPSEKRVMFKLINYWLQSFFSVKMKITEVSWMDKYKVYVCSEEETRHFWLAYVAWIEKIWVYPALILSRVPCNGTYLQPPAHHIIHCSMHINFSCSVLLATASWNQNKTIHNGMAWAE